MYLIYGKGKVGSAVAALCEYKGIAYEIKDDSDAMESFDSYEKIIPSPGVPEHHSIYKSGKILAELDFAYEFLPKGFQIISVTGTDGKSTTSWIMYNILEKEYSVKKPVYLSGNFDIPFSATILDILKKGEESGIIVVEVSSFMAFAIEEYQSDYSICTNIKADHLNWHTDLQGYYDAKMKVVQRTKEVAYINKQVIDFGKENALRIHAPQNMRLFQFGKPTDTSGMHDWVEDGDIVISGVTEYEISETGFSGMHNAMNILAAGLVARAIGIISDNTKKYLQSIKGLPHRLEMIGKKKGITIVEDSKSTSSQSLDAALSSFGSTKNLLLIVGGSDKGDVFDSLAPSFNTRVKAMVCIGATKDLFVRIAEKENIPYLATDSLTEGTEWLYARGEEGDVLMLSPGCASFGLFRDYFDRATQFREAIEKLPD